MEKDGVSRLFLRINYPVVIIIYMVMNMLMTIFRISVMYFSSIFLMRIAGKREVAQLEVSELVTSLLISEIACMPITDPDTKIHHAIVFTFTVILLEIIMTKSSMHLPIFKHMVVGKPDFLVVKGKLDKKALKKADVTLSELVGAMRKKGIASLDKINYAIQESDGTISVFSYDDGDAAMGVQHMLVCDGRYNKSEMEKFGYSKRVVESMMSQKGIKKVEQVFFLGVDDKGNVFVIEK